MNIQKTEFGLYQTDIDGFSYEFEKWGAMRATETLLDITAVVGQPLGKLAVAARQPGAVSGKTLNLGAIDLAGIVEELFRQVGTQKALVMSLLQRLTSGPKVQCNGKAVSNFDAHYQDRLPHMMSVAQAALEVQYGSFFGDAFAAVSGLRLKPEEEEPEAEPEKKTA